MGHFPKMAEFISQSVCLSSTCIFYKKALDNSLTQYFSHQCFYFLEIKHLLYFLYASQVFFFTSGIKLRANAEPAGDLPVWPFQHHCHHLSVHQGCTLATCLSVLTYHLFAIGLPDNPYNPFLTSVSVCHIHIFCIVPIYSPSKQRIVSVFVIFTK